MLCPPSSVFDDPAFCARIGLQLTPTGAGPLKWLKKAKKALNPPTGPVHEYTFQSSRIMPKDLEDRTDLWIRSTDSKKVLLYAIERTGKNIDGLDLFERYTHWARFQTAHDLTEKERELLLTDIEMYLNWLYKHLVDHVQPLIETNDDGKRAQSIAMRGRVAKAAELAADRQHFEAIRHILAGILDENSAMAKGWMFGVRRAGVLEAARRHLSKPDFQPGEWMNAFD